MGFMMNGLYYRTPEEAIAEKENELQHEIEYLQVLDPKVHFKIYQECLNKIKNLQQQLCK